MSENVHLRDVLPRTLVVARGRVNDQNMVKRIGELFAEVYDFLRTSGLKQSRRNVVVYLDEGDKCLVSTEDGVPIEVGVEVAAPFESRQRVSCSATPGGRVATILHTGPYAELPQAHATVRRWCQQNGHPIAGPNWEIYGDWSENPDELRTEVLYLLK